MPANTIFDAKRLIGKSFDDPTVSSDRAFWPFQVYKGANNRPMYKINVDGEEKHLHPIEISAKVLEKLKEFAETRTGKPVKKAVVTVPAYFNNSQK